MIFEVAQASGAPGPCAIPGIARSGLAPGPASLVLGACAHAFELDSLRKPGAGVHAGATVALPALAVGQAVGASGREVLTAIVAGCEVMFRIGAATLHTPEKLGFHAPGITGPFGAAAACGHLLRLDPAQLAHAFGIAGSLAGGLLAFLNEGGGGMVKRLHLGRAAEAGVLAARLASAGYEGPRSVLEGSLGVLSAFCSNSEPWRLTDALGARWETQTICFKTYPCHVTAHPPVQLLRRMMFDEGFAGTDIHSILIEASSVVARRHAIPEPGDLALAQYSMPFCTALAAYRDPEDPQSFAIEAVSNPEILALSRRIAIQARHPDDDALGGWGIRMQICLRDGREVSGFLEDFEGTPANPLTEARLARKFLRLCTSLGDQALPLLEELSHLETVGDVSTLPLGISR
jgi:2-methylcitrate dehydratase PrpD